jgi:hypothetical protein
MTTVVLDRFAVQVGKTIDRIRSVRVHDPDELGSSSTNPGLQRRTVSAVDVVLYQLHLEPRGDLGGGVAGTVVDHDELMIDPGASQHAGELLHRARERPLLVVRRNDDCEVWHGVERSFQGTGTNTVAFPIVTTMTVAPARS